MDGDLLLAPGFTSPPNSDYAAYHQYIDDYLPTESPMLYGLHPNAEISSLTATSEKLFKTVFEMQPRDTMAGAGVTVSREDKVPSSAWPQPAAIGLRLVSCSCGCRSCTFGCNSIVPSEKSFVEISSITSIDRNSTSNRSYFWSQNR